MLSSTLAAFATLTGGSLHDVPDPAAVVGSFQFDSRHVRAGELFLCLHGARDGHDFARQAVAAGAVGVLAQRPVGVPAVVVDDVPAAVAQLTEVLSARLEASGTRTVGITGSAGKTSTKDLIAQLLPALGPTTATAQSFNNTIGLPVTVSRAAAAEACRYLVLEMGARGVGHIRELVGLAPPLDVAVVLNVGTAHIGEFGSRDRIAQAKREIVEKLTPAGHAVLNLDDPLVAAMAPRTRGQVVWFGRSEGAHVRAEQVALDAHGRACFVLHTPTGHAPVRLQLLGGHQVDNALAAAAAAWALGMSVEQCAELLSGAVPLTAGRGQVLERGDGVTVVNDAYNANPDSVRAALHTLVTMTGGSGRRPVAVLGAMLELGDEAPAAHRGIGALARDLGVLLIPVGGPEAIWLADGAGVEVFAATAQEALPVLEELLVPGDVVLVKGSRDAGLQPLAFALAAAGADT
ncbi:UDP-N-acetylmuramoyl-tripeptide--D-alanyl-D-alanine ligase [Streptacidiphilus jiangxiensis]|uniref:UDP-N-acetylmuramoyl-tripeptide--D-alanyl-D-alanine ligase n=1 Tax=Streptacidiphilus jiangxiensis TaxID=235985 RepID=A0A1H7NQT0_STRJI|nr:UDP-N-acetylmuramoyl-tripeptide--D-alanyl-D-alanine ligase [Streptacidiphilus jiangxiensis]SEL25408.1 UDP-N-acetylmuramoyl-tripeptide--D-alanyl-D-alanine ligase [Streptacidiphilus jiangxiensis]